MFFGYFSRQISIYNLKQNKFLRFYYLMVFVVAKPKILEGWWKNKNFLPIFFHCQIWLNRRTDDGHLWLHHKIEKQKTHCLWPVPPVRENADKVGRSVSQSFIHSLHSFIYSSISPSLYILPCIRLTNEKIVRINFVHPFTWSELLLPLLWSYYYVPHSLDEIFTIPIQLPVLGGRGGLSFRFLHSKSVMDLIHVEDK